MNAVVWLQETPPDTSTYMIAGYIVFLVVFTVYLASFFIRRRNLEQDLQTLKMIQAENAPPSKTPRVRAPVSRRTKSRSKPPARKRTARRK